MSSLPKVVEENVLKIYDFKIRYYIFNDGRYVFDMQDVELFLLHHQADISFTNNSLLHVITALLNNDTEDSLFYEYAEK